MRNLLAVAAVSASLSLGLTVTAPAWAGSGDSVQDIIDALKPHPGKSRGSRPVVAPPDGDSTVSHSAAAATPVSTAPSPTRTMGGATHVASIQPVAPAAADDRPSLDFNITFASGSAELTPAAVKVLDTLGKALASADLARFKFRIEGHTDTVGTPDSNRELSARRADAVVGYLSRNYSIAADRLEAVGMGQEALLVQTGPGVPEQRNRRVHVVNVSG